MARLGLKAHGHDEHGSEFYCGLLVRFGRYSRRSSGIWDYPRSIIIVTYGRLAQISEAMKCTFGHIFVDDFHSWKVEIPLIIQSSRYVFNP